MFTLENKRIVSRQRKINLLIPLRACSQAIGASLHLATKRTLKDHFLIVLFGFTTNDLSHDDTYLRTNDCDALLKTKYMKKWARDNFQ